MDHAPISRACIPVKFKNESKYCDIALTDLTRESFFDDGKKIQIFVRFEFFFRRRVNLFKSKQFLTHVTVETVVPKCISSSNLELMIYDDEKVLIPINLLKKVITTYWNVRPKFYLRINVGELPAKNNESASSSEVIFHFTIKIKLRIKINFCLQELRKYLVEKNLKHFVVKNENNEGDLAGNDVVDLIRAAYDFLVDRHGPKHGKVDRTSVANDLHELFPKLDARVILNKLSSRRYNQRRPPKKSKIRNGAQFGRTTMSNGASDTDTNVDYEDLLEISIVSTHISE